MACCTKIPIWGCKFSLYVGISMLRTGEGDGVGTGIEKAQYK